jgi:small-conductance mechanosensitive channel
MKNRPLVAALCVVLTAGGAIAAQQLPAQASPDGILRAERTTEAIPLKFFNREIAVLRARVVGRGPEERVAGAVRVLDRLVEDRATGPVAERDVGGGRLITVAGRGVVLLTTADVDDLSGDTLDNATPRAMVALRLALAEADEVHAPQILIRAALWSLLAIAVGAGVLWLVNRARRRVGARLIAAAEKQIAASGLAPLDVLHASRIIEVERYVTTAIFTILDLAVLYAVVGFVLRAFPYTRVWGQSMRGFVFTTIETLGLQAVRALPGLFTVALIFAATRLLARLAGVWFAAVEHEQVKVPWLHPDTAQPTKRLMTALLWAFAVIVAYPYMPGSQTEGFKGVSVFLGLMLTLGSSGLVNQVMSGFMITYSRALRIGDFVKIGDVEGTVTHVGILSTKVRSLKQEEVTIPNAVVAATTTTDYSRPAAGEGVFTTTSVTIGYDTPWRQVHAMMLLAAARTPGLRREPKPHVLQEGLEDFYVKYTLWVSLERQEARPYVLDVLHANIQDIFNEYGVQIMSPNYVLDPTAAKVVPKQQWYAAPATTSGASSASGA